MSIIPDKLQSTPPSVQHKEMQVFTDGREEEAVLSVSSLLDCEEVGLNEYEPTVHVLHR